MKTIFIKKILFMCTSILLLTCNSLMAENWQTQIHIQGQEIKGMFKSEVTIGVQAKKSTMEAPPLPPIYSCRMYLPSESWMKQYTQWIKTNETKQHQWILAINPHGNYGPPMDITSRLSWDPKSFGPGKVVLKKGWQGDGDILADMKTVSSIDIVGSNMDQYVTIVYSEK
ncbi:conserved hypothetical protein, secreted [Candidatus Magnetomorum sp. HK-1]|nr:conserved hypothetical protein, secreted [Candidatus Magnetomorum sp. HK-1]